MILAICTDSDSGRYASKVSEIFEGIIEKLVFGSGESGIVGAPV